MKSIFLALLFVLLAFQPDNYKNDRMRMVNDQIISRGVRDQATLNAMRTVPRHEFVPSNSRQLAYGDHPLSIGYGQTISQPYIVAYMTEVLELKPDFKVLEIGTGSGYQAAVLSEIVSEVFTIEIIKELATSAKKRLQMLGYKNVRVFSGDGYNGLKEFAPFDAIMVTAGAESIPQPLLDQLKEGGRMIIPVGSSSYTQYLVLVEKKNGKIKTRKLLPVRFVPFTRDSKK
ncbi:MAG: protein-L-isoaspartate(D-aspartate) O-methyltransferase [Bacteroidales bacterium]|nr:protein-L-isoaspartate(D-aspartate) O-methyltransferase [Bacteroidales bacterium]